MSTDFSAKSSALGYLYQVRYALHVLLERGEEAEIAIETLDDITFNPVGSPTELLQLKHHIKTTANLSDLSPDIWKSLRVWSEQLVKGSIVIPGFTLTLVTTASAPDKSACSMLRHRNRNPVKALEQFETAAKGSTNQELQKAFSAFFSLTSTQRGQLVEAITILDSTPDIIDIASLIRKRIMYAAPPEFLDALYERLEGWWLGKAVAQLAERPNKPISHSEVHSKINDISEQLRSDSLPIDFFGALPPSGVDSQKDDRLFVIQLRDLGISSGRVENAILDYYRAFEQRSRWVREELLLDDELEEYQKRLEDEWRRISLSVQDDPPEAHSPEETLRKCGLTIYKWMEFQAQIHIRPRVTEPYVMRGSYQMLANQSPPKVWWHPDFLNRLKIILSQVGA